MPSKLKNRMVISQVLDRAQWWLLPFGLSFSCLNPGFEAGVTPWVSDTF
jgi:hypothetical protein